MKKLKLVIIILPVLFLLTPIFNFLKSEVWLGWGYHNHYFNLLDAHNSPIYLWREIVGEPTYPHLLDIAYYWPFKLLLTVVRNSYFSWLLYIYLVFLASATFFSLYVKRLCGSLSLNASLLLGLLYASYLPFHYEGFDLRIAAAVLPFLLWSLSTQSFFLLSSILALNLLTLEPRSYLVFLILASVQLAASYLVEKDKEHLVKGALWLVGVLAVSIILFLPTKYARDIVIGSAVQISAPVRESVLTRFFSPLKFLFHPHPAVRPGLLTTPLLLLLPFLVFVGLWVVRRKERKVFLITIFLLVAYFIFLAPPFLRYLTLSLPYGQLFRTWRLAQYLAAFLIPLSLVGLFVRGRKDSFSYLFVAFAAAYFALSVYSFGKQTTFVKQQDVEPYIKVNQFLKQDTGDFKVLWVPEMGWFGKNSRPFWVQEKETMQGFPENISAKPTYWHYTNRMTHFYTWLSSGIWSSQIRRGEDVSDLLNILGIKYLIVHDDVPGYREGAKQIIDNLSSLESFALVYQEDYLYAFKNLGYQGRVWASPQKNAVFCEYGLECLADFYKKTTTSAATAFVTDAAVDLPVLQRVHSLFVIKDLKNAEREFYNLVINSILASDDADSLVLFAKDYFANQDYTSCLSDTHHGTYHEFFKVGESYDYANSFGFQNCFFLLIPRYPKIFLPVSVKSGDYVVLVRYLEHSGGGSFSIFSPYFSYNFQSLKEGEVSRYTYFRDEVKVVKDTNFKLLLANGSGANFVSLIALVPKEKFEKTLAKIQAKTILEDVSGGSLENSVIINKSARINPSFWRVGLSANKPFVLNFAESYNPFWKVRVFKGSAKQKDYYSQLGYGSINSFLIDKTGNLSLEIVYEPQEKYYHYLLCSILLSALMLGVYWLLQRKIIL